MKLDATVLRTMQPADFLVLEAVELGMMKDHALVPLALIANLAKLRHGGCHKIVSSLLRDKLLSHERKTGGYDGYRVTTAGYDILALHALKKQKYRGGNGNGDGDDEESHVSLSKAPPLIAALGPKIGTGKESDIYLAVNGVGEQVVLKFHRLGRTSFRNVQQKRDYGPANGSSWLFLSRASAVKEFAFMKALHNVGYPTPTPLAHNRHVVCMNLIRGLPLYQIYPNQLSVQQAQSIYEQAVAMLARLASKHGLVHCDLNEFNLMIDLSGIQSLATSNVDDPYVRHSGQSVVSAPSRAAQLSAGSLTKPAWEQSLEEEHATTLAERLPEPAERLANGEAKPIVTLIDFPQMISTSHPNAQELYERDLHCLQRFFTQKLQCHIPPEAMQGTSWDDVMGNSNDGNDDDDDNPASSRLDAELKASGCRITDAQHLELYYFQSNDTVADQARRHGISVVEEEEEDDEENDEDDKEQNDQVAELRETAAQSTPSEDDNNNNNINPDDVGLDPDEPPQEDGDFDDGQSMVTTRSTMQATQQAMARMDLGNLTAAERQSMAAQVKQRVKKQLEEQKRKARTSGAHRASRNKNKQYVKGKRVLKESFV
mmetsp:Transcript_22513/g.49043  ORF Transcript_22513/g.49043 Transcript_22513/m.49043 type:complete len:600 (+) Transcript_22513:104-1903(+)|eukprot:CAMPEP_0168787006 /NCGR_PEP_ID=MMETSP0725-20121227/11573_1 /TAXON_ID=265536 /ORGANISM="Amphiprora sp., Strain CCMP467" /LENGTH=599 /DNA_ID=CAMNT_0008837189 /DNA_START=54 /DNA_END=1853 /DNA_ORIENTATION=-